MNVISTYNSQQCHLNILKYDVGDVTEQDVEMAADFEGSWEEDNFASDYFCITHAACLYRYIDILYFLGIIYAFNTRVQSAVSTVALEKKVPIKEHNVIYKLVEDLQEELTNRLEPVEEEIIIGMFLSP